MAQLDSKDPRRARSPRSGAGTRRRSSSSIPPTSGNTRSSSSAPASPGASAAATLAELGYRVKCFVFHDSPRRAHSIAAQGGINAAKNYQNDGDSVYRLFYDTIKGGDYRSREANIHRLAEVSVNIIDQCVAQGVPVRPRVRRPPRQPLLWRRPGVAHLLRARPDRPAAPSRSLFRAFADGRGRARCELFTHSEMLDLVVVDGHAKGIIVRDLVTGEITPARGRRGRPRDRRLRQRLQPVDLRARAPTRRRSGAPTSAARASRTPASRRSTRPASR